MSAPARKIDMPEDRALKQVTHAAIRAAAVSVVSKLAYTIEETCEATGLSKSTIYEEASDGHLRMGKLCGRTVIKAEELRRWFDARYEAVTKRD